MTFFNEPKLRILSSGCWYIKKGENILKAAKHDNYWHSKTNDALMMTYGHHAYILYTV